MEGVATVQRTLQRSELRILAILGVPTFALALAITTVSTYLPVLAEDFSDSSIVIGLLIGGEGLIALWLPLVVGSWSDRLRTPLGSRLPFILAATPALVVALALLGFVDSIAAAAVVVAVFFVGYFVATSPIARSTRTSSTPRSPGARRAARRSSAASGPFSPWSAAACSSRSPIRCPSWPPRSSSGCRWGPSASPESAIGDGSGRRCRRRRSARSCAAWRTSCAATASCRGAAILISIPVMAPLRDER